MLDIELRHWKVLWVARRKPRADRHGGCCDQTVSLAERYPSAGEVTTPTPGAFALDSTEGRHMEPSQEAQDDLLFVDGCAPQDLVHVDGAYPGDLVYVEILLYPLSSRAPAQCIDQNGGVEQQRQSSADTARVAEALRMHPAGWICIPFVLLVGEGTEPSLDVFASSPVVESSAQGVRDERAAASSPHAPVKLLHEVIIETYVQSHGHSLAHRPFPRPA